MMQIKPVKFKYLLLCLLLAFIGLILYTKLRQNGASSPEIAWQQLMLAMQSGDLERLQSLTTHKGFESLQFTDDENEMLKQWQSWGNYYTENKMEWLHWEQVDDNKTVARCCGAIESAFVFVKTSDGWKLDELRPGA